MKDYIGQIIDLTGDGYINPSPAVYDNGTHPRRVGQITSISVHHDATPRPHDYDSVARYKQEAAQHYLRLGPGLQYHYKIDNVGQIYQTRPLDEWLYCVGSAENVTTIAICLDGYLHNDSNNWGQDMTREQGEALFQLLKHLCTEQPDIPATWPNVRPHADFSSTACCGNRMTGHIYPITDEATAQAQLLNQGVYDWPELQPAAPAPKPVPAPTPAPTPVPTPVVDNTFKPARYIATVKTHLDDIVTGQRVTDYQPTFEADFVRRLTLNGQKYLQTQYSVDKFANRAFPEKDFVLKNQGNPTPPSDPGSLPTPPVPEQPPSGNTGDHNVEDRLTALEAIVKAITDFLDKVFKWRS